MTPFERRVRRLFRKAPVLPTTTAKVFNAKGKHIANIILNGTGTRRRVRVIKRRRRA